jgi:iron(III) transport system ATP-binding protein
LSVSGLSVRIGGRQILESIDFAVPQSAYTCVLGDSGAGKSTLLSAIAGTVKPYAGKIEINKIVLSDAMQGTFLAPQRRHLGMVFQNYLLWPHLSSLDNVALALRRRHGRMQAKALARDWLARVGLRGMCERYPAELSGGQQQRVALARALALEPRLVLLDEPLSALDAHTRTELRNLLRRLVVEHGFTAVHVTHNAEEALSLADNLVVMHNGHIVQAGPREKIFTRPATPQVARLTGEVSLIPARVLAYENERAVMSLVVGKPFSVAASNKLRAGCEAILVLRPQALSCVPVLNAISLPAKLIDACFLGDRWRVEAEIAGSGSDRVVFWHDSRPQPEFEAYLRTDKTWAVPPGSA